MLQFLRRWLGFLSSRSKAVSTTKPSPPVAGTPSKSPAAANTAAPAVHASVLPTVLPAPAETSTRAQTDPERDLDRPALGASHRMPITSWAYLLQGIDIASLALLDVDLVVVDYSADGSADGAFTAADVARMRSRPKGRRKRVVAYLSIGEAESYRYYWRKVWQLKDKKPAWLDGENPDWDENYKVRYWDPGWQRIIFGAPHAYLDRIMAAGFDGVYLDIIDAYESYARQRPSARQDMIAFVTALAGYARQKRPDFMIIPQNGEALLQSAPYRSAISAIAKEDLYFGVEADEKPNSAEDIQTSLDMLDLARKDGIPVMVVEYLDDVGKIRQVHGDLTRIGFTAYFAPRELDGLRDTPPMRPV